MSGLTTGNQASLFMRELGDYLTPVQRAEIKRTSESMIGDWYQDVQSRLCGMALRFMIENLLDAGKLGGEAAKALAARTTDLNERLTAIEKWRAQ